MNDRPTIRLVLTPEQKEQVRQATDKHVVIL